MSAIDIQPGKLYRYKDGDRIYSVKFISKGAGPLKGKLFVTYAGSVFQEPIESYVRELEDFKEKMVPVVF